MTQVTYFHMNIIAFNSILINVISNISVTIDLTVNVVKMGENKAEEKTVFFLPTFFIF